MRSFKEFLVEWSYTDIGVNSYMKKQGYDKLGAGVDQTAWHKPGENTIIKIFGTQKDVYDKHSADHIMFKFFAEYCEKHKGNKFLPKFYGWESFEWNNQKYLQIRMEMLAKLTPELGEALETAVAFRAVQADPLTRTNQKKSLMNFSSYYEIFSARHGREHDGAAQLAMLLGEKGLSQLYDTVAELGILGRAHNWGIDLHRGNFMMRSDGTPVIVDPWVV